MPVIARDWAKDHRRACSIFGDVVANVGDRWTWPSPCTEWDARGVLEHVIGFHEVLVLRPAKVHVERPKTDIPARWVVTQKALDLALCCGEQNPDLNLDRMLSMLTTEVIVHTWDLSRAVGVDEIAIDEDLVEKSLESVTRSRRAIAESDLYAAPIERGSGSSALETLLCFLGREPEWSRPQV
jgi:uncharacterized protein (TIGR03083 family)